MTVSLDSMRLFSAVATAGGFTAAAKKLGVPKQTLSRRVAELEAELGAQLLHRTTRTLRLTDAGRVYAARCEELARIASEANEELLRKRAEVGGTLRITADPLFGEAFLGPLIAELKAQHRGLEVEVMLVQRQVDLVEEGFDCAFRVGRLPDSSLIAVRLGPASMAYCASPEYLQAAGEPVSPSDLERHQLIVLAPEAAPARWLFACEKGKQQWLPVRGWLRVNHLGLARSAALAGLGIAAIPHFAIRRELEAGRLRLLLQSHTGPFGGIHLVYPPHRQLAPRVRAFVDLVKQHFQLR